MRYIQYIKKHRHKGGAKKFDRQVKNNTGSIVLSQGITAQNRVVEFYLTRKPSMQTQHRNNKAN